MRQLAGIVACACALVFVGPRAARAETYAVLVGINDYRYFGVRDLQYAESDVELMRDTLARYCDVPADNMRVLLGSDATRRAIGVAIRVWLAEVAGPDDRVLFYFAGHGTQLQDDNGDEADGLDESLWAWDTGILDLTWVRDDDLNRWLSFVKARDKVVILDCCHSGTGSRFLGENQVRAAAAPASEVRITSLESKVEAERAIEADASSAVTALADVGVFTSPGAGDIVAEFAACRPHQLVVETAQYKHGALTYFLTEGLRGAADDDADGAITLGELQTYSARRIQEHGFPQQPQLYGAGAASLALVEGPPLAMRGATEARVKTPTASDTDDAPRPTWEAVSPYLRVGLDDGVGGSRLARLADALSEINGVRVGGDKAPDIVVMATPGSGPDGGATVRTADPLTGESGQTWEIVSDEDVASCLAGLLPLVRAAAARKALLAIQNVDSPYRIRQAAVGERVRVTCDPTGALIALSVSGDGQLSVATGAAGALLVDAPAAADARSKVVAVASSDAVSTLTNGAVVPPADAWEALRRAGEELASLSPDAWGAAAILRASADAE